MQNRQRERERDRGKREGYGRAKGKTLVGFPEGRVLLVFSLYT
jgi:hypothetical protein